VTGIAYGSPVARAHIHSMVEQLLVGRDPRGVRGLWQKMDNVVFKGNNRGIVNDAISAIDVALWDLKAKLNDEPLWKTLGASTRPAFLLKEAPWRGTRTLDHSGHA